MKHVEMLYVQLNAESSGDAEDYLQKLQAAEMLIKRMKERDFIEMKESADVELKAAKQRECFFLNNQAKYFFEIKTRNKKNFFKPFITVPYRKCAKIPRLGKKNTKIAIFA